MFDMFGDSHENLMKILAVEVQSPPSVARLDFFAISTNTLQLAAPHCNALQRTATHCNG